MKGFIMHKSLLVVLAAATLPVAANAAVETETVTVGVTYADLALDKPAGTETLSRRVKAAIDAVCTRPNQIRSLKAMREWQECRDSAESQAREQLTPVVSFTEVALAQRH